MPHKDLSDQLASDNAAATFLYLLNVGYKIAHTN